MCEDHVGLTCVREACAYDAWLACGRRGACVMWIMQDIGSRKGRRMVRTEHMCGILTGTPAPGSTA